MSTISGARFIAVVYRLIRSSSYASGVTPVTYSIESPFPIEVDDAVATYTGLDPSHNFDPFKVKTVPSGFIHQPLIVQQEDAKLGGMLLRAIEDETFREEMQDKSGGNGRLLLQLLADHGKTAKPRDITLVTTKYNTVASAGVSGPLTRESFNEWIKRCPAQESELGRANLRDHRPGFLRGPGRRPWQPVRVAP